MGGLIFNIGNVAGSGLGTDAMFGMEPRVGGALSALLMGGYRHPVWLLGVGVLAWLVTLYLGYNAVLGLRDL